MIEDNEMTQAIEANKLRHQLHMSTLTHQERTLIAAMRKQGYLCEITGNGCAVSEIPINGWRLTGINRERFRSVQSAADWLCPLVKDSEFTELVSQ